MFSNCRESHLCNEQNKPALKTILDVAGARLVPSLQFHWLNMFPFTTSLWFHFSSLTVITISITRNHQWRNYENQDYACFNTMMHHNLSFWGDRPIQCTFIVFTVLQSPKLAILICRLPYSSSRSISF